VYTIFFSFIGYNLDAHNPHTPHSHHTEIGRRRLQCARKTHACVYIENSGKFLEKGAITRVRTLVGNVSPDSPTIGQQTHSCVYTILVPSWTATSATDFYSNIKECTFKFGWNQIILGLTKYIENNMNNYDSKLLYYENISDHNLVVLIWYHKS
jgi:hypothetical protein